MLRLASLLVLGVVFSMPCIATAQNDCGCNETVECCDPCQDSCCRTRCKLVRECKEVTRCKRVHCVDECGCRTVKKVPCTKTVSRLKFVRVPVAKRCGRDNNCGCDSTENSCGCDSTENSCGCDSTENSCGCDFWLL